MHIKKFRGKTAEDVLKIVKLSLGDDAVILSTKKSKGAVEVLAAVDFDVGEIERHVGDEYLLKDEISGLKKDLSDIKGLFSTLLMESAVKDIASLGSGAVNLYNEMTAGGVRDDISQALIRQAASSSDMDGDLREKCLRIILERTTVCNPLSGGSNPRLLALCGPSGAGKTTTIAKIAGMLSKKYGAKVGLVNIDCNKTCGNEMLKASARTFGIPVENPLTREEFNKVIWRHKDKDLLLIDTPGRNPKDVKAISDLKNYLNVGLPIKTALVLSVSSRNDFISNACEGFGMLPIDCLIFTKIDEAESYGSIMNSSEILKKPIAYLCDGPGVPQDIMSASREAVGNLILGRKGKDA